MQAIFCLPQLGVWRLVSAPEFICAEENTVNLGLTKIGRASMIGVHASGALMFVIIVFLFPFGIWWACRDVVRSDLWDDESYQVMFGNFYAGFKPRYWWFFTVIHGVNDIWLSFIGVALANYVEECLIVNVVSLVAFFIVLCWCHPYEELFDLFLDLANTAIALFAIGLSEMITHSKGTSVAVDVALWINLALMIVFTSLDLLPLFEVAKDFCESLLVSWGMLKDEEEEAHNPEKDFGVADTDESGQLSRKELADILMSDKVLSKMDTDHNGLIDKDEFEAYCKNEALLRAYYMDKENHNESDGTEDHGYREQAIDAWYAKWTSSGNFVELQFLCAQQNGFQNAEKVPEAWDPEAWQVHGLHPPPLAATRLVVNYPLPPPLPATRPLLQQHIRAVSLLDADGAAESSCSYSWL
jgi:hypothetical protein